MTTRNLRWIMLVLAALALGMHLAHALELQPKLGWDAALYVPVQATLYAWFGRIGPVLEVGALVLTLLVAWRLVGRPRARHLTLVSSAALVLALIAWALIVLPANAQIRAWPDAASVPGDWTRWRDQWQYGQALIFLLHIVGFSALVRSLLVETPAD